MIILLYRHDIIITEFLTSILTLFHYTEEQSNQAKIG